MAEEPPAADGNEEGDDEGEDESPGLFLHTVDQVHAEERGDERGEHHDDGDRCQRTNDVVHVVVDDRLIGVHRRLQDVGVDISGLAGLCHLDIDVFYQVGVQLVDL